MQRNQKKTMGKTLIAYYSRRGENYVGGVVKSLQLGNTECVAEKIAEQTGADSFRIETVKAYPTDYMKMTEVAMQELQGKERPTLTGKIEDMSEYDTIILGYPNWWGTMPMCVFSFLEAYDLTGKKILPFCTHEGSRLGHSIDDIRKVCPNAEVKEGLAIRGSDAASSDRLVREWLKKNKI